MAELVDDWPSLAPIRTSCSSSSFYCEANTPTNPTTNRFSLSHKADNYPFQSTPYTSSSPVSFFHSSTSTKLHLFSKCFPTRPNSSHAFSKAAMVSPGRDTRRSHAGGIFRSLVSFSGPIHHSPAPISGVGNHSGPLKLGHSGPLKGYNNMGGSKGHAGNHAFTMIPANMVGKKKPPDYVSDEPSSPEVTCMGRVRRKSTARLGMPFSALRRSAEIRHQRDLNLQGEMIYTLPYQNH